jgi:hypothetical protein
MTLLRQIGSRESIPGNKATSRRWGVFECPICKCEVEKDLTHGKRNKTCGNNSCRTAAMKPTNPQKIDPETNTVLLKRTRNYKPSANPAHKATMLYLMQCEGYTKIGITNNVIEINEDYESKIEKLS